MNGRQRIAQHKARVDAVFVRAAVLEVESDIETRADFARYLCILISGYLEKSVSESVLQHARNCGSPSLQRFVEANTGKFTNVNCKKLKTLLGTFEVSWRSHLDDLLVDEVKDAVDSLIANRHQIAHGGSVGVTYGRVREYFKQVQEVVTTVQDLCDPI